MPRIVGNAGYGVLLDGYACQFECEVDSFHGELNRYSGMYIDNEQVSPVRSAGGTGRAGVSIAGATLEAAHVHPPPDARRVVFQISCLPLP